MTEFLFEVFCEEIPARMQPAAQKRWEEQAATFLQEEGLSFESLQAFITPRRLTLWVTGLPHQQTAQVEERRGPRVDAPAAAVEGFFKSVGLSPVQCRQEETPKGTFWVASIAQESQPTVQRLPEVCRRLLTQFSWPKSMRWSTSQCTWVRPIRRLLCLFDGKPVPWVFDAQGGVTIPSTGETQGHRFLSGSPFTVKNFQDYAQKLEGSFVVLDRQKRRERIQTTVQNLATAQGLHILPEDFQEGALLDEVTGLVEWPVGFLGRIDPAFLGLPEEVLTTPMRVHQRYFPLRDPKTQKLAPFFVIIANTQTDDGGKKIIAGNERVLRARLSDAQFFWEQDLKKSLHQHSEALQHRLFFQGLGTLADKVERLCKLALLWTPQEPLLEDAARLCKADLATGMVGEFPELQGIMGMHYARQEGLPEAVALAIRDHYWPQGMQQELPSSLGRVLGILDRIDTLVGFFALGLVPTGSKDPMGLRRAGFGLIQLLLKASDDSPHFSLNAFLKKAFENYQGQDFLKGKEAFDQEKTSELLHDFLAERFKYLLKEKEGFSHDHIEAVLAVKTGLEIEFSKQAERVEELSTFLKSPDGPPVVAAIRRVASILQAEEKKEGVSYQGLFVQPTLLTHPAEKALAAALEASPLFHIYSDESQLKALATLRPLPSSLKAFATLRPLIDAFFDAVTVNDADPAIRRNRLTLLAQIRGTLEEIADFSKLKG